MNKDAWLIYPQPGFGQEPLLTHQVQFTIGLKNLVYQSPPGGWKTGWLKKFCIEEYIPALLTAYDFQGGAQVTLDYYHSELTGFNLLSIRLEKIFEQLPF